MQPIMIKPLFKQNYYFLTKLVWDLEHHPSDCLSHLLVKGWPKLFGQVFLSFCCLNYLYAEHDKLKRPKLLVISGFIFIPSPLSRHQKCS